jgi:hypothetical protein
MQGPCTIEVGEMLRVLEPARMHQAQERVEGQAASSEVG